MTQHLTKTQIIDANIAAVEGGWLGALAGCRTCKYDYGRNINGHRCGCAIGVALTPEALSEIEAQGMNGNGVKRLMKYRIIKTRAQKFAYELQVAHDDWAGSSNRKAKRKARAKYFRLIGIPDPEPIP